METFKENSFFPIKVEFKMKKRELYKEGRSLNRMNKDLAHRKRYVINTRENNNSNQIISSANLVRKCRTPVTFNHKPEPFTGKKVSQSPIFLSEIRKNPFSCRNSIDYHIRIRN